MTDAHDDPTSFVPHLDARQRAMLAEMGVRVWAPRADAAAVEPAPAAVPAVSAPVAPPPAETRPSAPPAPATAPRPAPAAPTVAPVAQSTPPATAERLRPAGVAQMDWPALQAAVAGCEACGLCKTRRNTVFGVGDTQTDWMIVGEAPGENEDLQGEPFVGAAGQLLDNMLRAVGRSRSGEGAKGAYIANVLKCRPPGNRNPEPDEIAACAPYLKRQVALAQPKLLLAAGKFSAQTLLNRDDSVGAMRASGGRYESIPVVVTYHPSYLLRTPGEKAKAWDDLMKACALVP